jgi:hypothetical protein
MCKFSEFKLVIHYLCCCIVKYLNMYQYFIAMISKFTCVRQFPLACNNCGKPLLNLNIYT